MNGGALRVNRDGTFWVTVIVLAKILAEHRLFINIVLEHDLSCRKVYTFKVHSGPNVGKFIKCSSLTRRTKYMNDFVFIR